MPTCTFFQIQHLLPIQTERINSLYADYRLCYSEYANFLLRTGTSDSQQEYEMIMSRLEPHRQEVDQLRDKLYIIDDKLREVERTKTEF